MKNRLIKNRILYLSIILQISTYANVTLAMDSPNKEQPILPGEINIIILEKGIEDIISHNNIFNPLNGIRDFIASLRLVNTEFYNMTANLIKFANKYAQEYFADQELKLSQEEKNVQLKNIFEGPYSKEAEEKAAKLIIAGAIYKPALIKIAKVGKFKNLINILLHGPADNAKININLQDQLGNTALINALKFKNNDVAILLINNGADINVQNILDKDSALLISVKNHDNDIAKLIINNSKSDLNIKDKWNKTPLMIAARDNLEIVKLLLDSGRVNINSRDGAGRTALMAAISVGNIDIVKLLINKGAEISIKGVDDTTALMLAIKYPQILKLLIDTGKIDINAKNKLKATALSLARKMGFKEAVELLISAGAK